MNKTFNIQELYDFSTEQQVASQIIPNPYVPKEIREDNSFPNYDISALNTSLPANSILQMIQNAIAYDKKNNTDPMGIKLLFYGISGGGKTHLVHYIANSLGKKILFKTSSDILGRYVRESEKNIARAFSEAKTQDKVLLFDEADSFFQDRTTAQHSWEITQVNEFLTQMENYSGIVICTTNLREIMDKAMQRRFNFLVEFKPLLDSGIKSLLNKYFPLLHFTEDEIQKLCNYKSITPGDFGNLSSQLRFLNPETVDEKYIIEELCKIQNEKQPFSHNHIGFDM